MKDNLTVGRMDSLVRRHSRTPVPTSQKTIYYMNTIEQHLVDWTDQEIGLACSFPDAILTASQTNEKLCVQFGVFRSPSFVLLRGGKQTHAIIWCPLPLRICSTISHQRQLFSRVLPFQWTCRYKPSFRVFDDTLRGARGLTFRSASKYNTYAILVTPKKTLLCNTRMLEFPAHTSFEKSTFNLRHSLNRW